MANTNGTMGATPLPSAARAKQICDFFRTGSAQPTQATPTLRASTTGSLLSSATSVNITIPSGASVGDMMLLFVEVSASANMGSNPPGFSQLWSAGNSAGSGGVWWKILQVGDPGSTITWSGLSGQPTTFAWACYSNVDPAVPFSVITNQQQLSTVASFTTTSFVTASAQLVFEFFGCWFASTGGTISGISSGTNLLTVQPGTGNTTGGLIVNTTSQGAAGTAGGNTCTVTGQNSRFQAWAFALNGAPTGGTALTAMSFVETYGNYVAGNISQQNTVWKWPSASANTHGDWYLVIGYYPQTPTNNPINFYACEVYNTSNHTWNAPLMNMNNNGFFFPNNFPAAGTTPPWAYVSASPNVVGTTYSGQYTVSDTVSTGSSTYLLAANNDGFFYTSTNGGTFGISVYFGAFSTLVANPNISDPVTLCACQWSGNNQATFAGVSREPGWTYNLNTGPFGNYICGIFYPSYQTGITSFFGVLNGSMAPNDLYQAPANQPLCGRWQLTRNSLYWTQYNNQLGALRGLLPSWIKFLLSSGCNWGDTTTDVTSSDNLFYAGTTAVNTGCWIDTVVA